MAQNLQQVVVWQEEEPRKDQALLSEVISKPFLNPIKRLVAALETLHEPALEASLEDEWAEPSIMHCAPPNLVDALESCSHDRQLLLDIWRGEYRLEIQPASLHLAPLFEDLLDSYQRRLPVVHLRPQKLYVWRAGNGHGLQNMLVEQIPNWFGFVKEVCACILEGDQVESDVTPFVLHALDLLLQPSLSTCKVTDLIDLIDLLHRSLVDDLFKALTEIWVYLKDGRAQGQDALPVTSL